MRERLTANDRLGVYLYSLQCFRALSAILVVILVFVFLYNELYVLAIVIPLLLAVLEYIVEWIFKWKASKVRLSSNTENQTNMMPMPSISSNIPQPPWPTPSQHIPGTFPGQTTYPVSPTYSTNDPSLLYPLSLSPQPSPAYIASQSLDRSHSSLSTREWNSSVSPSGPHLSGYGHTSFARYASVEATTRHNTSLQPPAHPDVVADGPGLPPHLYTTTVRDEASEVCGPSSDELPSYEAAMSTRQAPADEDPTHVTTD